jgi:hypothetical protein
MSLDLVEHIANELATRDDAAITLGGVGDPLLHPEFRAIVRRIRDAGCNAIHVRTDLLEPADLCTDLINIPIDVVSIVFNADRQATYRNAMGTDRFQTAVSHFEQLLNKRAARGGSLSQLCAPWFVPVIARHRLTLDDLSSFVDRWLHFAGAYLIEPIHTPDSSDDNLIPLATPGSIVDRTRRRTMHIRSDGSVPLDDCSDTIVANLTQCTVTEVWHDLQAARFPHETDLIASAPGRSVDCRIGIEQNSNVARRA